MRRTPAPRRLGFLVVLAGFAACARQPAPAEPEQPRPVGWRVGAAEHLALWYHGLALTDTGEQQDTAVLPRYRPGYADSITAVKRSRGVYPTALDQRAGEFQQRFASGAYQGLQFVPLYFRSTEALFTGIELWSRAQGDPRRAGSAAAARMIAFLSTLFPRADQRRVVAEWAESLREEAEAFYHAYWLEQAPVLEQQAAAVQAEWNTLAPELRTYLDYLQLENGELFLVPALDGEGRTVTRGAGVPRSAVPSPPAREPAVAILVFVHELLYPLVEDVIRDYLSPVQIRQLGEATLASRAAARGGAILLDRAAPSRATAYRRYYLRAAGHAPPGDDAALEAAFSEAFPIPAALERGLDDVIGRALAGI